MTESKNPVALADASGVVYTEGGDLPVYVLLQVKKDASSAELLDVDISTEGLNKVQAVAVLEAVLKTLKEDDSDTLIGPDVTIKPVVV